MCVLTLGTILGYRLSKSETNNIRLKTGKSFSSRVLL
jgi:hypothetical protein